MSEYEDVWKTVYGFHNLLRLRSEHLAENCLGVARVSRALARAGQLSAVNSDGLYAGALLKDIGKIGIPDQILHSKQGLTQEQSELLRSYPLKGFEALREVVFPWPEVVQVVHSHHEKFDGSGYPQGLAGGDIPLAAQIVAISNFFVSLTRARQGWSSLSPEQALQLLKEGAGSSFNPELVDLFEAVASTLHSHQG